MSPRLSDLHQRVLAIKDSLTVRTQIAAAGAMTILVVVGLLAASAAWLSYANTATLLTSKLSSVAAVTAERLQRYLVTRQREVLLFSRLEPMQKLWQNDPEALRKSLEQLQQSFSDFAWIGFARLDGTVVAATGRLLEGKSVAARPWFKEGLNGPMVGDVHEAALLASLLAARPDGEPHRFVDVAVPVHGPDGALLGVLGGHLDWDWARRLIASVEANEGAHRTTITIFSASGDVLLGPAAPASNAGGAALNRLHRGAGGAIAEVAAAAGMLTAFQSSLAFGDGNGLNWIVAASQPSQLALAAAAQSARIVLAIGALAGLIGIVMIALVAHRIARPIHSITREADRIGRTFGPTMLQRKGGSAEVVQLSRALRSLLRRIGFAEERIKEAEARATENARQFEDDVNRLRRLADTDALTGLLNRRAFLAAAEEAIKVCRHYKRGLAALMIDVDHFKLINDRHGHPAGDAVIKRVADIIAGCVRSSDKAARFGGEEFVVLLREIDADAAGVLADRIRSAIADEAIRAGGELVDVTASIGVALFDEADRDVQDLIERADQGLYLAKNSGRNRAVFMPRAGDSAKAA